VLAVAAFHTLSWQVTSGYVDILRTCFEVAGLLVILETESGRGEMGRMEPWSAVIAGMFVGLSLLTKAISLVFLPAFPVYVWMKRGRKFALITAVTSLFVWLPCVLQGWWFTGSFPPSSIFGMVGESLIFHASGGVVGWLGHQLSLFVTLPVWLPFWREGYTSLLFLIAVPFFLRKWRWLWTNHRAECIFLFLFLGVWILIVPVSIRYGLSGILLLLILAMEVLWVESTWRYTKVLVVIGIACTVLFTFGVRVAVLRRGWPYLMGKETERDYVRPFIDGVNRGPMERWYGSLR
jgi:hypothetical protein